MKLHIFNPEHEMALALNADSFSLPHNIQEFRMNLGFLPALWASDGDCVLVDDVAYAVKALAATSLPHADVLFLADNEIAGLNFDAVEPWGWNRALRRRLSVAGIDNTLLPDDDTLESVRDLANRMLTTDVLMAVREGLGNATCGKSFYITDPAHIGRLLATYGRIVLKAPWSSSGRGVRYLDDCFNSNTSLWAANVIRRQGGLMAEPFYSCIKDFAMEFCSDDKGGINYCGLSVFQTENGNYAGNIIDTEEEKKSLLSRYIEPALLDEVRNKLTNVFSKTLRGRYTGPFGVDMMIVAGQDGGPCRLHPCVEINLRRTMGHVANSFKTSEFIPRRFMRISHGVNYTFRVITPDPGFVKC